MREQWQPQTAQNILHRLETDIFPYIGRQQIFMLTSKDLIYAVRQMEKRSALEVARRVTADVSRVFVYAFHCGLTDRNPAMMLTKCWRRNLLALARLPNAFVKPAKLVAGGQRQCTVQCSGQILSDTTRIILSLLIQIFFFQGVPSTVSTLTLSRVTSRMGKSFSALK